MNHTHSDVEEDGEWVRYWIPYRDNEFDSLLLVRALINPEYVGQSEKSVLEEDISRMLSAAVRCR